MQDQLLFIPNFASFFARRHVYFLEILLSQQVLIGFLTHSTIFPLLFLFDLKFIIVSSSRVLIFQTGYLNQLFDFYHNIQQDFYKFELIKQYFFLIDSVN